MRPLAPTFTVSRTSGPRPRHVIAVGRGARAARGKGIIMSVAQVLNVSGEMMTGTPPPEAQKMAEAAKLTDGLEHIYTLGNPGGPGLTILVWRDKAAMEAGTEQRASDEARLQSEMGITVVPGEFYGTFTEL
jgi:hypothetical protein